MVTSRRKSLRITSQGTYILHRDRWKVGGRLLRATGRGRSPCVLSCRKLYGLGRGTRVKVHVVEQVRDIPASSLAPGAVRRGAGGSVGTGDNTEANTHPRRAHNLVNLETAQHLAVKTTAFPEPVLSLPNSGRTPTSHCI